MPQLGDFGTGRGKRPIVLLLLDKANLQALIFSYQSPRPYRSLWCKFDGILHATIYQKTRLTYELWYRMGMFRCYKIIEEGGGQVECVRPVHLCRSLLLTQFFLSFFDPLLHGLSASIKSLFLGQGWLKGRNTKQPNIS